MKAYCPACKKMVDYAHVEKDEWVDVDGRTLIYRDYMRVCKECGNEVTSFPPQDRKETKNGHEKVSS